MGREQEVTAVTDAVELKGMIHKITYRNEANAYTVAILYAGKEPVTIVGTLPFVNEGDRLVLTGQYQVHPTYGQQFKVTAFQKEMPTTAAAILRYLSTGAIRGVGPSTARALVEKFGDKTLEMIADHPSELTVIRGISEAKAREINAGYRMQLGAREMILLFQRFDISPEDTLKIYKTLGTSAVEQIKHNPYILCDEAIGLSFEKAEDLAEEFQISKDDETRLAAGIEYVLRRNLQNGHTCLPLEKLIPVACRLLETDSDRLTDLVERLVGSFRLHSYRDKEQIYVALPDYYAAEEYVAARLLAMDRFDGWRMRVSAAELDYVQSVLHMTLDEGQKQAVISAFESGVFILTGGPGTGKTTTLKAIIELFEYRNMTIELAAPTGRAAKRMSELTGRTAKTLHRLLEVQWGTNDRPIFVRDEQDPLECEVMIVDECSMVDALLFESLLKALRPGCKLLLVGDSDQLPSVSAGNLLNDLLCSECFSSVRLDKVFRQAESSAIVTTAHDLIQGREVDLSVHDSDLFFISRNDDQDGMALLLDLCSRRLPEAYGFDPMQDIQILCPSRKMPFGSTNLNDRLQQQLNPSKKHEPEIFFKGFYFRKGDKVMQIRNNYEIGWEKENGEKGTGAFNGDVGIVTAVNKRDGSLTVCFEDRQVVYGNEELSQLELAYAITVHKSQGSEFECVILPLLDVPTRLCYRNLLYTAVTRAKKLLVMIGSREVFYAMAGNDKKTLRYTLLQQFLRDDLCLMK